ncbi:MAG: AAA family ATPase [Polyangiaceae bacterium]
MLAKDPPRPGRARRWWTRSACCAGGCPGAAVSVRPEALTHAERRVVCFVAAGKPAAWSATDTSRLIVVFDACSGQGASAREIAERHGGQIELLTDGSFLVTFSTAGSATELSARAARCALALRSLLPSAPLVVAMGRSEQSGPRFEGPALEIASELLRAVPVEERGHAPIRVDASMAELLDLGFEIGRDAKGSVLLGERHAPDRPRLLLGKPTPCVGRDRELSALRGVMEECVGERVARVALVTGQPGSGKSRLLRELLPRLREQREAVEVWMGAGQPLSVSTPFALMSGLLCSAARVSPEDSAAVRRQKLGARVGRYLDPEAAARVAAFLGEIAGAPAAAGAVDRGVCTARADPAIMGEQLRRAWIDLLRAELERHPVVLVLEDLHWGDRPSVELVLAALRRLPHRPLLVLGFARPDVCDLFPKLSRESMVHEIRLAELTPRASERLLRSVLGGSMGPEAVAAIVGRAGGNPFYLEELLRAAAGGRGDSLPETVLAMVEARLQGLDPAARRVLRAASIFGPRFHIAGVRALLGDDGTGDALSHWLDVLVEAELLEPPAGEWDDGGEMTFRHALVCEAVSETLAERDRLLGHRLAAAWLAGSDHDGAAAIAHHFSLGGEPARAAEWHLLAAETALKAVDFATAVTEAQRGIDCGAEGEVLGGLHAVQMHALVRRGDAERAGPIAPRALSLLPRGSARWCSASATAGYLAACADDLPRLLELAGVVLSTCASPEPSGACLRAICTLAILLVRLGRFEEAAPLIDRVEAMRSSDAAGAPLMRGWIDVVRAFRAGFMEADPWRQREHALAASASPECLSDLETWGCAMVQAGAAALAMGSHAEAVRLLREAIDRLDRARLLTMLLPARAQLATALAHQGALREARAEASAAACAAAALQAVHLELKTARALVQVLLLAGDLDAAEIESRAFVPRLHDPIPSTLPHLEATVVLAQVHAAHGRSSHALGLTAGAMRWLDA